MKKSLKWQDTIRLPWGVLLLLGSGMSFAKAVDSSGLSEWVGTQISNFGTMNLFLLLLIITIVNFLTEIASNMATIAMMLPILAPNIKIGIKFTPVRFNGCFICGCLMCIYASCSHAT